MPKRALGDAPPVAGVTGNLNGLVGGAVADAGSAEEKVKGDEAEGAAVADDPNGAAPVPKDVLAGLAFALKENIAVAGAAQSVFTLFASLSASSLSALGAKPLSSGITAGGPGFTKLFTFGAALAGAVAVLAAVVVVGSLSAGFAGVKEKGFFGTEDEAAAGELLLNAGFRPVELKEKASGFGGSAVSVLVAFAGSALLLSSLSALGAKPSSSGITAGGPGFTKLFTFGAALAGAVAVVAGAAPTAAAAAVVALPLPAVFSAGIGLKEKGLADGGAAAATVVVAEEGDAPKAGFRSVAGLKEKVGCLAGVVESAAVLLASVVVSSFFSLLPSALGAKPPSSATTADGPGFTKLPNGVAAAVFVDAAVEAVLAPKTNAGGAGEAGFPPKRGTAGSSVVFALPVDGALPVTESGTVNEFSVEPGGMAERALLSDTSEVLPVAVADAGLVVFVTAFSAAAARAACEGLTYRRIAEGSVSRREGD